MVTLCQILQIQAASTCGRLKKIHSSNSLTPWVILTMAFTQRPHICSDDSRRNYQSLASFFSQHFNHLPRFDIRGTTTASWYQAKEGRVASGWFSMFWEFQQRFCAQEISQLKEEITDISTEIDAMDTEEGWDAFSKLNTLLYPSFSS